jgi:hypothetical protein
MGAAHPLEWARDKRKRLEAYAGGDLGVWAAKARDVCLPGLPLAVLLGFAANGNAMNTTGWLVGDERERAESVRKGKRPFAGDPHRGYGAIGSKDLHELGEFGIEGGHEGTPCATDPECAWVVGAKSDDVAKILGRPGVVGERWYKATADNAAIGAWNLRRHMRAARVKLEDIDPRLSWVPSAKPVDLWQDLCASASWSAGSRGFTKHVRKHAAELAPLPAGPRVGRFLQLAARDNDPGRRHDQDEWTALRWAQKHEAACRIAPQIEGEEWALEWLRDDGLSDGERDRVYARLVEVSG